MKDEVRAFLNGEVSDWYHCGVIDEKLRNLLAERYDRRGNALALLIKWLAFFALFFLVVTAMTFVAAMVGSEIGASIVLAVATWLLMLSGIRLVTRVPAPHTVTGSVLISVGLGTLYGALGTLWVAMFGELGERAALTLVYGVAACAIIVAYRFRIRWPLFLGLIMLFHAVGFGHTYFGTGAYGAWIQDERLMACIALFAVGLGLWHEQVLEAGALRAHEGFGRLYIVFGLLYFNASLWFLSLQRWLGDGATGFWLVLFTISSIAQLVLGARLKDGRLVGFGVVFLSINLYTRYFEQMWWTMEVGEFFLVAGIVGMAIGHAMERMPTISGASRKEVV